MLILARKEDESIMLVKIGIDAPKNMMILRSELVEDVAAENKQALNGAGEASLKELSDKIVK